MPRGAPGDLGVGPTVWRTPLAHPAHPPEPGRGPIGAVKHHATSAGLVPLSRDSGPKHGTRAS